MNKRTRILALALILVATQGRDARTEPGATRPHYSIDLEIHPGTQAIEVAGTLTIPLIDPHEGPMVFHLHEQLAVDSFAVNLAHELDVAAGPSGSRFLPHGRKIVVTLDEAVDPDDVLRIDYAYRGTITRWPAWSANVIGEEWTEIGLYFPWFPYNQDLGLFTYEMNVTCDPGYALASPGRIQQTASGWSVTCVAPTNDLVVCLARDIEVHEAALGRNELRIYHSGVPARALETLSADVVAIDAAYDRWFGAIGRDVCIVESRRERGGGYGRIGAVFLGGFDGAAYESKREPINRYLAHELAHQWWYRARTNSWEDWLNESFAEYSAMLIIRERFGVERYDARLDEKRQSALDAPPIRGLDRNADPDATAALYDKGPVLLHMLEDRIGREQFARLCREAFQRGIDNTEDLLGLLETTSGDEIRAWFADLLVNQ